jgi:hypothetical protein
MNNVGAYLILGGVHLVNGTRPARGGDEIVIVTLTRPAHAPFPSNTVVVDWSGQGEVRLEIRSLDGNQNGCTSRCLGTELFDGVAPGPALRALDLSPASGTLVPIFYIATDAASDDNAALVQVFTQVQSGSEGSCFLYLTSSPAGRSEVVPPALVASLLELREEHAEFLNNHRLYYRKASPELELEHKLTLRQPADIWCITLGLYEAVRSGGFPGFAMEFENHLQQSDYRNFLYEVVAPETERGYVSFIPTVDGLNLLKQKWFTQDSLVRRESLSYKVDVKSGYADHLANSMGLTVVPLPPFKRFRYDLQVESLRTGNVYGVFLDQVSLLEAPDKVLNQVEIEYRRSRSLAMPTERGVLDEMETVVDWAEAFLTSRSVAYKRGFYSKLSFLRDVVAANPALAVA